MRNSRPSASLPTLTADFHKQPLLTPWLHLPLSQGCSRLPVTEPGKSDISRIGLISFSCEIWMSAVQGSENILISGSLLGCLGFSLSSDDGHPICIPGSMVKVFYTLEGGRILDIGDGLFSDSYLKFHISL